MSINSNAYLIASATQDSNGYLKVIIWNVNDDGTITRISDASAGKITQVSLTKGGNYYSAGKEVPGQFLVTAAQDSQRNLNVISWQVDENGRVVKKGQASAGKIGLVSATGLDDLVATATQDSNGNLKVIVWGIDEYGVISRKGDSGSAGEKISQISEGQRGRKTDTGSRRLYTAVQDSNGNLKVIVWEIDKNGVISRKGDSGSAAGKIGLVSTASILIPGDIENDYLATATQDSNGNLKVIVWEIDKNGVISRKGDSGSAAGKIGLVSATYGRYGYVATATQDSGGKLKVIVWKVDDKGNVVTRESDSGSAAGKIGLVSATDNGYGSVATATQDSNGNLKVIVWGIDEYGVISRKGDSGSAAGKIGLVSANYVSLPQHLS
ncbi:hypothetical protein [Methanothrix soehngenii]|uniref:hypothetical protein n=1 Tax=Methanothrix soehngenii TaxID=2223 RepID=UPI002FE36F36